MKVALPLAFLFLGFSAFAQNCSPPQMRQISKAEREIYLKLHELNKNWHLYNLIGVKRDFVDPEGRAWVNRNPNHMRYQNYWYQISDTLKAMESKFSEVNFSCKSVSEKRCRGTDTIAYVMFIFGRARPTINLCPVFFEGSGLTDQTSTIFHELSHYAASTEDYALDWIHHKNPNLERAAKDAYHIEAFMNGSLTGVLRNQIWIPLWPRPAQE